MGSEWHSLISIQSCQSTYSDPLCSTDCSAAQLSPHHFSAVSCTQSLAQSMSTCPVYPTIHSIYISLNNTSTAWKSLAIGHVNFTPLLSLSHLPLNLHQIPFHNLTLTLHSLFQLKTTPKRPSIFSTPNNNDDDNNKLIFFVVNKEFGSNFYTYNVKEDPQSLRETMSYLFI